MAKKLPQNYGVGKIYAVVSVPSIETYNHIARQTTDDHASRIEIRKIERLGAPSGLRSQDKRVLFEVWFTSTVGFNKGDVKSQFKNWLVVKSGNAKRDWFPLPELLHPIAERWDRRELPALSTKNDD